MRTKSIKNNKRLIIVVLIALIILVAVGFVIPFSISDGSQSYSGPGKAEAVSIVLRQEVDKRGGFTIYPKIYIEDVMYTPTGKCTDPANLNSYSVRVKAIGFFGFVLWTKTYQAPLLGAC